MEAEKSEINHSNVALIYEYTKEVVQDINLGIDRKINRLGATLAFCGVTLKLASDMPSAGLYFSVKAAVCLCLLIAIGTCIAGLIPMQSGNIPEPKALLDPDIYRATEEEYRITLIDQWINLIPSLDKISRKRGQCLNIAFGFLSSAVIILCISIVVPNP